MWALVLLNALLETVSCVYSEIMSNFISFFQKLIKGGVGIRAGEGLENFSRINKRGGGDDYSVLESIKLAESISVQIFINFEFQRSN